MNNYLCTCFICVISCTSSSVVAAGSLADRYVALAIQGDLRPAQALLEGHSGVGPGGAASAFELATRFRQRFVDRTEPAAPSSGNTLVDEIVTAYRAYWTEALMAGEAGPEQEAMLEAMLVQALAAALAGQGPGGVGALAPGAVHPAPAGAFSEIGPALERQGFRALVSPAPPLQDLFVWRAQERREFEVELTDHRRTVQVAFLSDFSSLGWKDFAALGLATTSGWVDGGTLYCVAWAYQPGSEAFEVSFLKHETRHLVDYGRFPGLDSEELEYRAKLTELAFASTTLRRLLEDFSAKAAPNPSSPHAAANYRVVRDVASALSGKEHSGPEFWSTLDTRRVQRVARDLLEQSSGSLEADRTSN